MPTHPRLCRANNAGKVFFFAKSPVRHENCRSSMKLQSRQSGAYPMRKGCSPDAPSTTTVGTTVSTDALISVIAVVWRSVPKLCPVNSLPFVGGSSCDDILMRKTVS